ncbi:MAG: c-type cytochrome [Steroidobacteraceae bacterium]
MSKQDTHFFNVFSVVLGLLVAFAILMFALARYVGKHEQNAQVLKEPMLQQSVDSRVGIPARIAVAGQDNSALKIAPVSATAAAPVAVVFKTGSEVFEVACKTCHGTGLAGAPKAGDHAAWGPRIAKGKPTLYEHALKGFSSKPGSMMPAKGGFPAVSDDLIKAAVDHMTSL